MQVINDSPRRDDLLDLLLVDKEEMLENVKVKDSPGYSKYEAAELMIHREKSKKKEAELQPWTSEDLVWSAQDLF